MKTKLSLLFILFILLPCLSWAADFGLLVDQTIGIGGYGNDGEFDYMGSIIPRFSTLVGTNGEFYASAGISAERGNNEWSFVPELLRTEFTWFTHSWELKLGRTYYSDPLGYITEGLFDGFRFTYDTKLGSFGAGAWYTGFLYKKRANIEITREELLNNTLGVDYSDFIDTYFASRRIVAALDWSHPNLAGSLLRTNVSLIGQFDLNGYDVETIHSQYLVAKLSLPYNAFLFDLGGSFSLMERDGDVETALAAELKATWVLPTPFSSRLSLLGIYTSGVSENTNISAFLPVTTRSKGEILMAKLSGLSFISLDYIARLHRTFSARLSSSYFISTDKQTFYRYPIRDASKGYFLGNEFFGQLYWSPFTDLTASLGGGIFLPSMGNAAPNAENLWRLELNIILSLF